MDWQQVTSLIVVALTAGTFLLSKLRRRKFGLRGNTGCACSSAHLPVPPYSIVFRARRGEKPEIVVKMK